MKHRLRGLAAIGLGLALASGDASTQALFAKKLLFLTHAGLYKHASLGPAEAAVTEWGKTSGFEVTTVQGYEQDSRSLDLSFLTRTT